MKKTILFVLFIGLLLLFGFSLRKVPAPLLENCSVVKGRVEKVHSPCCSDIVIQLANNKRSYYINRGLEEGLELGQMKADLEGKDIVLQKINHWTLLDPENYTVPLAEVKVNDEVYFSRMLD